MSLIFGRCSRTKCRVGWIDIFDVVWYHPFSPKLLMKALCQGCSVAYVLGEQEVVAVMREKRGDHSSKSLHGFQEAVRKSGPAASASYTLIGAILLLGGSGYLLDRWQLTSPWFLLLGLLLGVAVGLYELAKTVWK